MRTDLVQLLFAFSCALILQTLFSSRIQFSLRKKKPPSHTPVKQEDEAGTEYASTSDTTDTKTGKTGKVQRETGGKTGGKTGEWQGGRLLTVKKATMRAEGLSFERLRLPM